jgi:hypothetical protein
MRKATFIALILFFLVGCKSKSKIIGEWTTQDKYSDKGTLIFKEDGTFISINGDGKIDNMGFKTNRIKYELNQSKNPNWLDFVFFNADTNEEIVRMRGIIEFLSDNTARIGFMANKSDLIEMLSRPKSFEECEEKIISKK